MVKLFAYNYYDDGIGFEVVELDSQEEALAYKAEHPTAIISTAPPPSK